MLKNSFVLFADPRSGAKNLVLAFWGWSGAGGRSDNDFFNTLAPLGNRVNKGPSLKARRGARQHIFLSLTADLYGH